MGTKKEASSMMTCIREGKLPGSEMIVNTAFNELGYVANFPDQLKIRHEFNSRLKEVFEYTLVVLERYEEQAYLSGIPEEIIKNRKDAFERAEKVLLETEDTSAGLRDAFRSLFADLYLTLRHVFLSISQSRKTRGGKDFELQFGRLLEYAGVPYQKIQKQTRTDFMVPSDEVFNTNPNIALVLSAKRTLRERWREVAEELFNLRSPNVYLITADEKVTRGHVDQICGQYRIHLVIWDGLKNQKFQNDPLVIGFTKLATEVFSSLKKDGKSIRPDRIVSPSIPIKICGSVTKIRYNNTLVLF